MKSWVLTQTAPHTFVACSTNAGEGLSHVVWCTWTCGGVAHSRKNSK